MREGSKWVTVQDCNAIEPVSIITGGRRYTYMMQGQLNLVQRCKSDKARHAFVVQSHVCGPNAFVDCVATNNFATSEPHHRWSVGGLYDNVNAAMAFQDRQWMGSGHGWAGANYVAWNCEGSLVCQKPPTAQNWSIGFVGKKEPGAFKRGDGVWESYGKHVEPRSLYLKQLEDRLGKDAVTNVVQRRRDEETQRRSENAETAAHFVSPSLRLSVSTLLTMQVQASDQAAAPAQQRAQQGDQLTIQNKFLRVTDVGRGKLKIEPVQQPGGPKFTITATLCPDLMRYEKVASNKVEHNDAIGKAQAIEFSATRNGDATQTVWLYDDQPFVFSSVSMRNTGKKPVTFTQQMPISCAVETSATPADLKVFGADGLSPADDGKTVWAYLALVDPKTRGGIVGGWISHDRGSGVVAFASDGGQMRIDPRAEYGAMRVDAGKDVNGETFAIGYFGDCRLGLEAYADAVAKNYQVKLPPAYCGYSTWYHAKASNTPGSSDEKHMAALAKFAVDQHLKDFGLDFLQIDDGWQISRRDFTTHKPNGAYPHGMKQTAQAINDANLIAGIWLTPFGWHGKDTRPDRKGTKIEQTPNNSALKDHPDWFVHRQDGSVYDVFWAWDCLDMSNPPAREFLRGVISRITHDWGYKLLKLDGLWAGMACKILYPSPEYADDNLGDAVFHDPTQSNVQVYRSGLKLVRDAAGPDVFLLGCNIAQNMRTLGGSFGVVDAMRIGPDIKADWGAVRRCARPAEMMYFLNGRVWHNDPDCLMLREPLTLDNARAWGSFIGITGQLNLVSEWLPDMPPERLDVWKRSVPNHNKLSVRPVDLFTTDMPRVWHLSYGEGDDRHDVVALFNWNAPKQQSSRGAASAGNEEPTTQTAAKPSPDEGKSVTIDLNLPDLGLKQDQKYAAFDFWSNQFLSAVSGSASFELPAGSCKVIALKAQRDDRPTLLSTSRHVSQGAVDVLSCEWDATANVLRGMSKVVIGDDYELRIDAPTGRNASAAKIAGGGENLDASVKQDGRNVRVAIKPAKTGEVAWAVSFAPAK
jgi:hypothetical protein